MNEFSRLGKMAALVGALVASLVCSFETAAAREANAWAAFAPEATFDSASTALATVMGLDPNSSLYLYREGFANPSRILLECAQYIYRVSVAPGSSLVAVDLLDCGKRKDLPAHSVLVIDSTGQEIIHLRDGRRSRWSSDGSKLVIWYASDRGEEYPEPDSVGVWEASPERLRTYRAHPYDIGWVTNDVVLLDGWSESEALDLRTGSIRPISFRGQLASPDAQFSISDRYENGVRVWDERSHEDMTKRIETLLDGGRLSAYPEPFWIGGADHLLCIPACRYTKPLGKEARPPECRVYVVDVEAGVALQEIPGKGIGPTADRRGVVTLRGKTLRFVSVTVR